MLVWQLFVKNVIYKNLTLSHIRSCYIFQQEVSLISEKTLKATCVKEKVSFFK